MTNSTKSPKSRMVYVDDDTTKEKRFESIKNVETDMTDEEIKQFEEDWTKFWNPEVTKKEIKKLDQ